MTGRGVERNSRANTHSALLPVWAWQEAVSVWPLRPRPPPRTHHTSHVAAEIWCTLSTLSSAGEVQFTDQNVEVEIKITQEMMEAREDRNAKNIL